MLFTWRLFRNLRIIQGMYQSGFSTDTEPIEYICTYKWKNSLLKFQLNISNVLHILGYGSTLQLYKSVSQRMLKKFFVCLFVSLSFQLREFNLRLETTKSPRPKGRMEYRNFYLDLLSPRHFLSNILSSCSDFG